MNMMKYNPNSLQNPQPNLTDYSTNKLNSQPESKIKNQHKSGTTKNFIYKSNDIVDADIDGYISDDATISNKIPESHIRVNSNILSGRPSNQLITDDDESVLKGSPNKNYSNGYTKQNYQSGKITSQEQEAIKTLIYTKSPREIAENYFHSSRIQQQQFLLQQQQNQNSVRSPNSLKSRISPNKFKNYPYTFNTQSGENIQMSQSPSSNQLFTSQDGAFTNFANGSTGGTLKKTKSLKSNDFDSAYTELANKIFTQKLREPSQGRDTQFGKGNNMDLMLSPQAAKEIQNKKLVNIKDQEDHANKLLKQKQLMNERSKARAEAYINKELEECTFTPKTNAYGDRRTINEFMEDQKKFLTVVELKKKKIMQQVQVEKTIDEGTYKPELCKGSLKILEKKQQQKEKSEEIPAHQRLYKINKNAIQKQVGHIISNDENDNGSSSNSSQFIGEINKENNVSKNVQITFIPNIQKRSKNLKRNDKIDNILYNDAMRRQHKSIELSRQKPKVTNKNMSNSSKRALATRFIKEFDTVILEFLEVGKEPKLDYLQLNEFLKKLCFLKDSETLELPHFTPERILLYDMWYSLNGDKYKGIHRRNLLVFLLAVFGLHYQITKITKQSNLLNNNNANALLRDENDDTNPMMMKRNSATELQSQSNFGENNEQQQGRLYDPALEYRNTQELSQRQRKILGTFDDAGNLELTNEDVKKIQKLYDIWYLNRLCSFDNIGQMISNRKFEDHSYHPEILETSKQLAQSYRGKILEETADLIQKNKIQAPKDGKLTHADLLVLTKKVFKEKVKQESELIKEGQLKECTFRPQTLENTFGNKMGSLKLKDEGKFDDEQDEEARKINKNKVFELYSLAKQRNAKKDRNPEEIEFEKYGDECTFTPDITTTKNKKLPLGPTEIYAKNIEKTIDRLRSARIEREQLNSYKERGTPTGNEGYFQFGLDTLVTRKANMTGSSIERIGRENIPPNMMMMKKDVSNKHKASISIGSIVSERNASQHGEGILRSREGTNVNSEEKQLYGRSVDKEDKSQLESHRVRGDDDRVDEQTYEKYGIEGEQNDDSDQGEERVPLLFVDVNLGQGRAERIVVFEGDKSEELAKKFAEEHGLDSIMRDKLKELLDSQIAGVLSRIDEEANSMHSDTEKSDGDNQGIIHEQIQEKDELAEENSYIIDN